MINWKFFLNIFILASAASYFAESRYVKRSPIKRSNDYLDESVHSSHLSLTSALKELILEHKKSLVRYEHEVVQLGPLDPEFVTVVSIYFPLKKSKHSLEEYDVWVRNMLLSVEAAPLVMFTDKEALPRCIELRNSSNRRTTFYVYDDLWTIMKELEERRSKQYLHNYQHVQYELDTEKQHTPELYAVWNLKPYYTNKVSEMNLYNSDYFIYTDAGAWREAIIPQWPDVSFVRKVAAKTRDLPLFGQVGTRYYNFPWDNNIEGTWFAGSSKALLDYEEVFYSVHDTRMENNQFMGKDQALINLVNFGPHGKFFDRYMNTTRIKLWELDCGDIWFVYQKFFAPPEYYTCQKDRLPLIQDYDEYELKSGWE